MQKVSNKLQDVDVTDGGLWNRMNVWGAWHAKTWFQALCYNDVADGGMERSGQTGWS